MYSSTVTVATLVAIAIAASLLYCWRRRKPISNEIAVREAAGLPQVMKAATKRLELGTEGSPLITISALPELPAGRLTTFPIDRKSISNLAPLMQQAPGLAVAATTASTKFYELTFSPEVAAALDQGSLTLKNSLEGGFRAMAEDSTGKIVKHGSLHPMELLKSAATAAAVWQVVSMVVAQKHLADINQKLDEISNDIKGIQSWMNHQEMGILTGNYEYLNTIATCFLNGELSESELGEFRRDLEQVERQSLQIAHATKARLSGFGQKIEGTKFDEWFGTKEDTAKVQALLQEHEQLARAWIVANRVRAAACQLTCALPGEQPVAERRLQAIKTEITAAETWESSLTQAAELIFKLHSPWNKQATLAERRTTLHREVRAIAQRTNTSQQQIIEYISEIEVNALVSKRMRNEPLRLAAEVDSLGNIVNLSHISGA